MKTFFFLKLIFNFIKTNKRKFSHRTNCIYVYAFINIDYCKIGNKYICLLGIKKQYIYKIVEVFVIPVLFFASIL